MPFSFQGFIYAAERQQDEWNYIDLSRRRFIPSLSDSGSEYDETEDVERMLEALSTSNAPRPVLVNRLPEELALKEDPNLYPEDLNFVPSVYRGCDSPYDSSLTSGAPCTISVRDGDGFTPFGELEGSRAEQWINYTPYLDSQYPHHAISWTYKPASSGRGTEKRVTCLIFADAIKRDGRDSTGRKPSILNSMMAIGQGIDRQLVPDALSRLAAENKLAQLTFDLFSVDSAEPDHGLRKGSIYFIGPSDDERKALTERYRAGYQLSQAEILLVHFSQAYLYGQTIIIHRIVEGDGAACRHYNSMLLYFDAIMEQTAWNGYFWFWAQQLERGLQAEGREPTRILAAKIKMLELPRWLVKRWVVAYHNDGTPRSSFPYEWEEIPFFWFIMSPDVRIFADALHSMTMGFRLAREIAASPDAWKVRLDIN